MTSKANGICIGLSYIETPMLYDSNGRPHKNLVSRRFNTNGYEETFNLQFSLSLEAGDLVAEKIKTKFCRSR